MLHVDDVLGGKHRLVRLALATLSLTFAIPAAHAQPGDPVSRSDAENKARAEFDAAKTLRDQGRWEEACARFEVAQGIFPSGGTTLSLADCRERFGKPDEARQLYQSILDDPANQSKPDRLAIAKQRIEAIDEKKRQDALVVKPPSEPDKSRPPATAVPPAGASIMNPVPGIILFAVSGASFIVGGVLGGVAMSEIDAVKETCRDNACPPSQQAAGDAARAKAIGADVTFGIGAAAAVTGLVLLLTIKTDAPPPIEPTASGFAFRF